MRFDRIQQPPDLLPAQHDRQFPWALRSLELPEVAERRTDDMLEVEDERVERLSLRRRRHLFRHDQALEECAHGIGILPDAAITTKCEESVHPENVRLFGTHRIAPAPDRVP